MKRLIFGLILVSLILLTACDMDTGTIENGTGSSGSDSDSDSGDGAAGLDDSDTGDSESTETGRWSLDDFPPGAESLVYYTGSVTERNEKMASSFTEYFANEEDWVYSQSYSFTAIRVYYGDMSMIYIDSLDGSVSLDYEESSEQLDDGNTISKSISDSDQGSSTFDSPRKIGQIDADGEVYFSVFPSGDSFSNTCNMVTTYADGTSETHESSSCGYQGLSVGGGQDQQCQPSTADMALEDAGYCKLYVSADGSVSGTFSDLIYTSDEDTHSNQVRTIIWSLTPNEALEEPFYAQGE